MTDSELRRLEREFRQSGTLEAEAALVEALLRAGRTNEERLKLVEFLRRPLPSRRLFYFFGPQRPRAVDDDGAEHWVRQLATFGQECLLRAAFAGC